MKPTQLIKDLAREIRVAENATKAVKSEPSSAKVPVEEPPSTHSDGEEESDSPAHTPSPGRDKTPRKKATKPSKPPKMPKAPKPPKVPKVKEGGKKKGKKAKELTPPPPKPSSFAALESHAKDILSKMDQPKKGKVSSHLLLQQMFRRSPVLWSTMTTCQPGETGDRVSACRLMHA